MALDIDGYKAKCGSQAAELKAANKAKKDADKSVKALTKQVDKLVKQAVKADAKIAKLSGTPVVAKTE